MLVAEGKTAKLVCLVKIKQSRPQSLAVLTNDLHITRNHPVRIKDEWKLPKNLTSTFKVNTSGELFCFVLEPPLPAMVNGVECATLGHELKDKLVEHPYYGTQVVIDDLKQYEGWNSGYIEVEESIQKDLLKKLKPERLHNRKAKVCHNIVHEDQNSCQTKPQQS